VAIGPTKEKYLRHASLREERDAAGLVLEHRRQLGVDVVLESADQDGDRPQHDGASGPERADRGAERRDEKARIGERDDEAVPPGHGLEELPFLYVSSRHASPSPEGGYVRIGSRDYYHPA
jgi:hypothetical protein